MRPKKLILDPPIWVQPEALVGSAVRHIALLSPRFHRVEWVPALKKNKTVSIGRPRSSEWSFFSEEVTSVNADGKVRRLGSIRVFSQSSQQFTTLEQEAVNRVAKELGDQWPQE